MANSEVAKKLESKENQKTILISLGVTAVLLIGGIAAYHFWIKDDKEEIASSEKKKEEEKG